MSLLGYKKWSDLHLPIAWYLLIFSQKFHINIQAEEIKGLNKKMNKIIYLYMYIFLSQKFSIVANVYTVKKLWNSKFLLALILRINELDKVLIVKQNQYSCRRWLDFVFRMHDLCSLTNLEKALKGREDLGVMWKGRNKEGRKIPPIWKDFHYCHS